MLTTKAQNIQEAVQTVEQTELGLIGMETL